jgi:multiple sugar transport system permease protein
MAREQSVPAAGVTTLERVETPTYKAGRWPAISAAFNRYVLPRIVLLSVCAIYILPFYWMVVTALKSHAELGLIPPTLYPHDLQWSNFPDAVDFIPFWKYFRNTSVITLLTIIVSVVSNPIIAYGFSRIEWPGRDKIFYLVLATVFIPFPVLIVALFDIFATIPRPMWNGGHVTLGGNWVNTYLPLVVPLLFGNAFWIFLMRQFLMQVSFEISDAARIDGANEFRIFYQIVLPQALPAVGVISIFAALHAWNDFLGPLIYLQDEAKYTLAIGLTFFRSQRDVEYNLLMACATLIVLPVIVLFLFFQRAFVEGISVGSVKG